MMRTMMIASVAMLAASTALAQSTNQRPRKDISIYNCADLKGKPLVCLINETDEIITDIDCKGSGWFHGTKPVSLPKGGVAPHSFTIVNMGACNTNLIYSVLGGTQRMSGPVDTSEATMLEVPKQ